LWGANWHQALAVMMRTLCEKGLDWHQTVLDVTQRFFCLAEGVVCLRGRRARSRGGAISRSRAPP